MSLSKDYDTVLALSRFGLGASDQGWQAAGDALSGLHHEIRLGPSALEIIPPLPGASELMDEYYAYQNQIRALRRQIPPDDGSRLTNPSGARNLAEIDARLSNSVRKPRFGFNERLVMFWANHFAVATDKSSPVRISAGAFEREAIRPNIYGRFTDLVMAVETHPSMLTYLDNVTSIGPESEGGRRGHAGLNENLAREIMELHVLGVGNGYTQADVTAFAAALTGWSVNQMPETSRGDGDGFDFIAANHQPGDQEILGKIYPDAGFFQAADIIVDMTRRPATARHIAFKLARHFVSDSPPPSLVDRLADTFLRTGGDLSSLYITLIESEEAWVTDCVKIRTPQEHLIAMLRGTGVTVRPTQLKMALYTMGQPLWTPSGPNGYPDVVAAWSTPEGLSTRVDVAAMVASQTVASARRTIDPRELAVQLLGPRLSDNTIRAVERAETTTQGLALVFMSPEFMRR